MTLKELLPAVKELPVQDKIKLIRILAEELETNESEPVLKSRKVYDLSTPYDSFGAGRKLINVLSQVGIE